MAGAGRARGHWSRAKPWPGTNESNWPGTNVPSNRPGTNGPGGRPGRGHWSRVGLGPRLMAQTDGLFSTSEWLSLAGLHQLSTGEGGLPTHLTAPLEVGKGGEWRLWLPAAATRIEAKPRGLASETRERYLPLTNPFLEHFSNLSIFFENSDIFKISQKRKENQKVKD